MSARDAALRKIAREFNLTVDAAVCEERIRWEQGVTKIMRIAIDEADAAEAATRIADLAAELLRERSAK